MENMPQWNNNNITPPTKRLEGYCFNNIKKEILPNAEEKVCRGGTASRK
jgi:hypothetical protein